MSFVSGVSRSHVSVNIGGARGFHLAVRALVTMPLSAKVAQMPGHGCLLGETTSAVETFEPFTLVRVISIPVQVVFLRRITDIPHVVPLHVTFPLVIT